MSAYDTRKYIRSPIDLSRSTSNVPHELSTRWSRATRVRAGLRGPPGQRVLEFLEPLGPAAAAHPDVGAGCRFRLRLRCVGHAADLLEPRRHEHAVDVRQLDGRQPEDGGRTSGLHVVSRPESRNLYLEHRRFVADSPDPERGPR